MKRIARIVSIGLALFFVFPQAGKSQFEAAANDHDDLPYYFGLTFGYNHSFLHTVKDAGFYDNAHFRRVEPGGSSGIELGLMGTLKLMEHWELRTAPKLIIGGSKYLTYYYQDGSTPVNNEVTANSFSGNEEQIKLPATIVSIPLHVKFSSDRIGNLRAYVFGGPKYDFNLSSNSQEYNKERELGGGNPAPQFRKSTLGAEGGVGLHIYLPFAVISPEIRVSSSLQNDHLKDISNPYSQVLDKINTRMLTFSINIEQ